MTVYRRRPASGKGGRRCGRECKGRGMGEGVRTQEPHHDRHVGSDAPLTPRTITHGKLQLIPDEREGEREREREKKKEEKVVGK